MNLFLQTGIGLIASAVAVWLIMIKRRAFRLRRVVAAVLLTLLCAGLVTMGILRQAETPKQPKAMSARKMVVYCNALLAAGEQDEALQVVEEYSARYGYDDTCSYLVAKGKSLGGNYAEAYGIYARLAQDSAFRKEAGEAFEEELAMLEKLAHADSSCLPMLAYLEEQGLNPADYGYTDEYIKEQQEALRVTDEQLERLLLEHIEDCYDIDKYEDYLEAAAGVSRLSENRSNPAGSLNTEEQKLLKNYVDDLEDALEEAPELETAALTAQTRRRAALMQENYGALAENLNENPTQEELLLASRLYMDGILKERDFAEDFTAGYGDGFEEVTEQLERVLERCGDEMTRTENLELKAMCDGMEKAQKAPALYAMKEELVRQLKEGSTEESKLQLAVSEIEYFYENEALSTSYFGEAVTTGKDSGDYEYSRAMLGLEGIINSWDAGEIKDVGIYVQQALEHAMPVDSYGLLPEAVNGEALQQNSGRDDAEQTAAGGTFEEQYAQLLTNHVSEIKSSVTIGQIDASEFETVRASVTISGKYATDSRELKEILSVSDCGIDITDFEIEKIEYDSQRTMLICDVSGSMDVCIEDLKAAVNGYVGNRGKSESIAIVTFADGVTGKTGFLTKESELTAFADSMSASGGTRLYDALYGCMQDFETTLKSNDIVIIMTDGQDGSARDEKTMRAEIGSLAADKGITVYTVGLGNVDTAYLEKLAEVGNGELVYVSDSRSLSAFYEMLQGQVNNQYLLTYRAKDTLKVSHRSLEVKIRENNVFDCREYSLSAEENAEGEDEAGLQAGSLSVFGLDVRSACKSRENITARLLGEGFAEGASASMKLVGDMEYEAQLEYADENTYKVVIPAAVAVGSYDLQITINDKSAYLENGFSVYPDGATQVTKYGPYSFTSQGKKVSGSRTVLLGNVTMNGWLVFNGEVILDGNLETDGQITVTENSGSYVMFDASTASGAGALFAKQGIAFHMPVLGSFSLYNDAENRYDYDAYRVDSIRTTSLEICNLVMLSAPVIKLYPDNIRLEYTQGSTILPFQDAIFTAADFENPFSFELEGAAVVTDRNIGLVLEFEGEDERENYRQFNLFNAPVYLDLNELKLSVDTIENKYSFGGMIQVAFLDFGLGAEVSLDGFTLDGFLLTIDKDKSIMIGEVPVTFSKARIGAEDIAEAVKNRNFGNVTLVGQLDIAVAKVGAYFPKLKKYVGDMSIASLEDATFKFRWNPFTISTSAEMKIFDEFTLAKSDFTMGHYEFTNQLLGLKEREVLGFTTSMTQGFLWDIPNCHVDISGTGTLTGNNRFMGIEYKGVAELDISWWIFSKSFDQSGTVLTGVYFTESGEPQFTLALSYQNMFGTNKKLYYYIDKNGKTGDKNGRL